MELAIVLLIVVGCGAFLVRRFSGQIKRSKGGGCGCGDACPSAKTNEKQPSQSFEV